MVRTVIAALALIGMAGCGSPAAKNPSEGEKASAASAASPGAAASNNGSAAGSSAATSSRSSSDPANSAGSTDAASKNLSAAEQIARGMKFSEQGRRRDALTAYTAALKTEPKNLEAMLYRAGEHYALQEYDAAEKDVTQALAIDPTYAEAYVLRAHLWGMKHEYQKAVDDFNTALKHPARDANFAVYFGDKKDVVAHVFLAAAYAECPDLNFRDDEKAYQHALTACQLDNWQNRRYVSLLVNAIAGAQSQEEALRRQEEAVAAAPTDAVKLQLQGAVEAFDRRSEFPLR